MIIIEPSAFKPQIDSNDGWFAASAHLKKSAGHWHHGVKMSNTWNINDLHQYTISGYVNTVYA